MPCCARSRFARSIDRSLTNLLLCVPTAADGHRRSALKEGDETRRPSAVSSILSSRINHVREEKSEAGGWRGRRQRPPQEAQEARGKQRRFRHATYRVWYPLQLRCSLERESLSLIVCVFTNSILSTFAPSVFVSLSLRKLADRRLFLQLWSGPLLETTKGASKLRHATYSSVPIFAPSVCVSCSTYMRSRSFLKLVILSW